MSDTYPFTPRCRLTARDHAILESMLATCVARNDPLVPLLRRKLAAAVLLDGHFRPDVATLDSRIAFHVDGRPDTRILVRGDGHRIAGMTLSVATPRGLALLGMAEGEQASVGRPDGSTETVRIDKVVYQPRAAGSAAAAVSGPPSADGATAVLVSLAARRRRTAEPPSASTSDGDDPGPTAA